jgi:hypothetical protein
VADLVIDVCERWSAVAALHDLESRIGEKAVRPLLERRKRYDFR